MSFGNPQLMVTPWNLPKIRDLGKHYLTEARRFLSLMDLSTQAHQRKQDRERKWVYRQCYGYSRRMALHAHQIASDLSLQESTLGKEAALVKLAQNYRATSQQEADPLRRLYEQAASRLYELLSANETESAATLLIEKAMEQAKQALATRGRRKREPCEGCKRGEETRCARGKALHHLMQRRILFLREQRERLPPAIQMREQEQRHLAAVHAAAIWAAGDWHLHCFGSMGS